MNKEDKQLGGGESSAVSENGDESEVDDVRSEVNAGRPASQDDSERNHWIMGPQSTQGADVESHNDNESGGVILGLDDCNGETVVLMMSVDITPAIMKEL